MASTTVREERDGTSACLSLTSPAIRQEARIGDAIGPWPIAGVGLRAPYGSQLFTAGGQLGYVAKQLGHGDVAVTARHYAR
jgi:hypothetical protein